MKEKKVTSTSEEVKLKASMEKTYEIVEDICVGLKKFDPDGATLIPIADENGNFQLREAKES